MSDIEVLLLKLTHYNDELTNDDRCDLSDYIEKLQAENAELKKQSQWISVEDELPAEGVIVALHGGDIESLGLKTTAGFYDGLYRCFNAYLDEDEPELCDACFWMPLPTLPNGE